MSIRVAIAEDEFLLRKLLLHYFVAEPDITVVAEASTGYEAVSMAFREKLDVILMDITMPGMNGADATRRILKHLPQMKIIALSVHVAGAWIQEMAAAGACAYINKGCPTDELLSAVRAVARGQRLLNPPVPAWSTADGASGSSASPLNLLSTRERGVLQLMGEGSTLREIADHLHIAETTVQTYRQRMMEKLNLKSDAEVMRFAILCGVAAE